nr:HlyD family type I secretion periplasmic adaptor subunit [Rhizobium halophytocola]
MAVLSAVVWATFARVNEVAVAAGSLVPLGFEQTVQHLEGGIVRSVLVRAGDIVDTGTPLFELRDASTLEDSETLDHQKTDLLAQLETQRALVEDRAPDFSFVPALYVAALGDNRNAYEASHATLLSQRREFDSQISQAGFALEALRAQLAQAQDEVEHALNEEKRYSDLQKKGVATDVQVSERRRLRARAEADVATLTNRQGAAIERLAEVEQQKASFQANFRAKVRQRILELENAYTALDGTIRKKDGRKERLIVTAPIRGIVKSVEVRGSGEVVEGGQALATIVPLDKPLLAETRVRASQIGYLKVGQEAHVKLTAYDFTRYGWLSARIAGISPSSFQQQGQGSYYTVKLALDETHLSKARDAPILPGMDLTADIITGQKTVLQYLLTPLQRTFSSAFGER